MRIAVVHSNDPIKKRNDFGGGAGGGGGGGEGRGGGGHARHRYNPMPSKV